MARGDGVGAPPGPDAAGPVPGPVEARPRRAALAVLAAAAVLVLPAAGVTAGDGGALLGLAALLWAAWALVVVRRGWSARSRADGHGVRVQWLGRTEEVAWGDVVAVQEGPGGAVLRRADGRALAWTPWTRMLWFARTPGAADVPALRRLLAAHGDGDGHGRPDGPGAGPA